MSIDTFNPNFYGSSSEALEALRREGINFNHRLGARLCALGRLPVLFSLAFLEEAAESEDFADCLRDKRWMSIDISRPENAASILSSVGGHSVFEDGILKVYTEDEMPSESCGGELALRSEIQGSVAPAVLGISDLSSIKGLLWDRRRIEEASLTLLDSEDDAKLIEAFRYLFRAGISCGQDPLGLLITAFKRGKDVLSAEAVRQVRDNLNRDLGRALGNLLSGDVKKFKDAVFYFNLPEQKRFWPVLNVIMLPALLPLVKSEDFKENLLLGLPHLAPIIGGSSVYSSEGSFADLSIFLDALFDDLDSMDLSGRFAVSAFIFDLSHHFKEMTSYLMVRFRSTDVCSSVVFLGNILARLSLNESEYEEVCSRLLDIFAKYGSDAGLSRRLRAAFRFLGTAVLPKICREEYIAELNEQQRMFIAELWNDFRKFSSELPSAEQNEAASKLKKDECCSHEHECGCGSHHECTCHDHECTCHDECCGEHSRPEEDPEALKASIETNLELWNSLNGKGESINSDHLNEVFCSFVINRLAQRDKSAALTLIRTEQINLPAVKAALRQLDSKKYSIYSFLFEEACRLEAPDDELVLELLASCGLGSLEFSFKVISEDAALESGGEAGKIAAFARLLKKFEASDEKSRGRINEMTDMALEYPSLHEREKYKLLPIVWEGIGLLGSVKCISEEIRMRVCDRLSEKMNEYPQSKVKALTEVYKAAGDEVKIRIERILRKVLTDSDPDRKVLGFCLEGLRGLIEEGIMPLETEALISSLCRTVLSRSKETSLNDIMKAMLSQGAEGDGIQMPVCWSHDDKSMALRIIGEAACCSSASERLHKTLVYRLFSFLDDWFCGIEKGENLYAYRSNPIWNLLVKLLHSDTSEFTVSLAKEHAVRLMSDYNKRLEGCDLVQSESAQRFLLEVLRCNKEDELKINGVSVSLNHAVLNIMMDVVRNSPPENKVCIGLLKELLSERILSPEDSTELEMFLASKE